MTEWTDWKPHDGKGVPAELKVGMMIQVDQLRANGERFIECGVIAAKFLNPVRWTSTTQYEKYTQIIRYRIRKPRALQTMIERAEALPVVKHLEEVR